MEEGRVDRAETILVALRHARTLTSAADESDAPIDALGRCCARCSRPAGATTARPTPPRARRPNRFNATGAYGSVKRQVELGPRPAGSPASRKLGERIRRALPRGRFEAVPGGLRNVVGRVPGRDPRRTVVIGAHYDTKDIPGFVGANDGAAGTAILTQLARTVKPRRLRSDAGVHRVRRRGEPAGRARRRVRALRACAAARRSPRSYREAKAMILLDFVGQKGLRIPREGNSDLELWRKLRAAARRAGVARVFPDETQGAISDDHVPFIRQGVPSIDLIDFDFPCFHRTCDDLSQISKTSLDAVGETMIQLLPRL